MRSQGRASVDGSTVVGSAAERIVVVAELVPAGHAPLPGPHGLGVHGELAAHDFLPDLDGLLASPLAVPGPFLLAHELAVALDFLLVLQLVVAGHHPVLDRVEEKSQGPTLFFFSSRRYYRTNFSELCSQTCGSEDTC